MGLERLTVTEFVRKIQADLDEDAGIPNFEDVAEGVI